MAKKSTKSFLQKIKNTGSKIGKGLVKGIKGRYLDSKTGMAKYEQMIADVKLLKEVVNTEKKKVQTLVTGQLVGQLSANTSGHYVADITPLPASGAGFQQRTGASIKLTSAFMKFQFYSQSNTSACIKGKIFFVRSRGNPVTPSTEFPLLVMPNDWIFSLNSVNVYDSNSRKNSDYFGRSKVIRIVPFTIKPDSLTSQVSITDVTIKWKMNEHVRYLQDSTTVTDGQLWMYIVCDNGNSGSVSTLNGVPILTTLTGLNFNYNLCWYYVDN